MGVVGHAPLKPEWVKKKETCIFVDVGVHKFMNNIFDMLLIIGCGAYFLGLTRRAFKF